MDDVEIKIDRNFIYATVDELYNQFKQDDSPFHIYTEKRFAIRKVDVAIGLLYGKSTIYVHHQGVRSDAKRPFTVGRSAHNKRIKKIKEMRNFIENRVQFKAQQQLKNNLVAAVRVVVPGVDTEIDKAILED